MTEKKVPSETQLAHALEFLSQMRDLVSSMLDAIYGGRPGGRPESDADQLRAVAAMLDEVDAAMNAYLRRAGMPELVDQHPTMQEDLRRIADSLGTMPGWGRIQ